MPSVKALEAKKKIVDEIKANAKDAKSIVLFDYILDLPCQGLKGPSSIHDAITGKLLRKGGV